MTLVILTLPLLHDSSQFTPLYLYLVVVSISPKIAQDMKSSRSLQTSLRILKTSSTLLKILEEFFTNCQFHSIPFCSAPPHLRGLSYVPTFRALLWSTLGEFSYALPLSGSFPKLYPLKKFFFALPYPTPRKLSYAPPLREFSLTLTSSKEFYLTLSNVNVCSCVAINRKRHMMFSHRRMMHY